MAFQTILALADNEGRKALGAYFTDELVSDFLITWAVRKASDVIMDPGFGDGVFLRSACKRILALGGNPLDQVRGFEISGGIHSDTAEALAEEHGLSAEALRCCNFFELEPGAFQVDAIVGNPPFVRYQRFSGEQRKLALMRASSQGVELSELASSWAAFLIHAVSMIKPGGRLAMVVPFELCQAFYARPVLQHLVRAFGEITLLTFEKKMFDWLNEETLLVLATDKGSANTRLLLRDFSETKALLGLTKHVDQNVGAPIMGAGILNHEQLSQGKERLINYLLPPEIRSLYEELKGVTEVICLGDLANVGIGYVTGANDFFHVSPLQAQQWHIPMLYLRPALRRGRVLQGTSFTYEDWESNLSSGQTGYLLLIEDEPNSLPQGVLRYLEHGVRAGVPSAFKCRNRSPWYQVPHVYRPDAFLTYMSGTYPKLVANSAEIVAPNSLHIVRLRNPRNLQAETLATLWQNSLTALSVEIEGHSLGGGMLKMEPTEARKVLVPMLGNQCLDGLADEIDEMCRSGRVESARALVDKEILRRSLGLSERDCALLKKGAQILAGRRTRRGGKGHRSAA